MSTPSPSCREVRVAIVGSGLTGLVATYLLTAHHPLSTSTPVNLSVEIFERAATLGMDSASISVPLPLTPSCTPASLPTCSHSAHQNPRGDNATWQLRSRKRPTPMIADPHSSQPHSLRIDVPMRAFTAGYYPQLLALYRHLAITTKKTNFTYSFAALLPSTVATSSSASSSSSSSSHSIDPSAPTSTCAPSPTVLYNGANGLRGVGIPADLGRLRISSPVRLSSILDHIDRLRAYFASLLLLVLGYLQLLVVALWHHYLGHTCDDAHPLRTYTLGDLVVNPFPVRSPSPLPSPKHARPALRARLGHLIETAAEHVLRRSVSLDERFVHQTLAPLFSAVMTSSLDSVWACPASQILDYVALTLGKDHFVVNDGVRTVVASLLQHIHPPQSNSQSSIDGSSSSSNNNNNSSSSKVWTNAEVRRVHSQAAKAWIDVVHHCPSSPQHETAPSMSRQASSSSTDRTFCDDRDDESRRHGPFDHVIFATQANQTAHFLQQYVDSLSATADADDASASEQASEQATRLRGVIDVLASFKYEKSVVVNHTDRSLLPRHRADWRDLNLVSPASKRMVAAGASGEWESTDRRADDTVETRTMDGSASQETLFGSCSETKLSETSTMATHVVSLPPSASASDHLLVLQTTNPLASLTPHPTTVLSQSTFERAVIDVHSHLARQSLFLLSRHSPPSSPHITVQTAGRRLLSLGTLQLAQSQSQSQSKCAAIWVCGSWAVGIPLLEGCVVSARLVAEHILQSEHLTAPPHARW